MATNAALNATVQDLLQRTTAAEALGAQLLQQHAASAAQIAEQAGMLGQLEQDNAALVAQLADNTTSQVAQAALNAIPTMSEKMASKMAAIKDSYVTSREVWDILSRTQPDINKARSLIGRIVRLSGAALTGAELSAQSIKGQYHEFSESYYKAARPLAYKTPEQADWSPDQHLLPDAAALEKVKKAEKADKVRTERESAERDSQRRRFNPPAGGAGNNNGARSSNFTRPFGSHTSQQQQQQPHQPQFGGGANNIGGNRPGGGAPNFVPGGGRR